MISFKKSLSTLPALLIAVLLVGLAAVPAAAQVLEHKQHFTHQDTLRGSITPERAWWNVTHYAISVTPDYGSKTIRGSNEIRFKVVHPGSGMQIDLQEPMEIVSVTWQKKQLSFTRDSNVYFVDFPQTLTPGKTEAILVAFKGKPREAVRPPWDGGWIWTEDDKGRPWMSVACQGLGASVWYPCKDIQSDEPDSGATLSITVPSDLVAVGNGRMKSKTIHKNGTTTWCWEVVAPINNYDIIPYIGHYVHWDDIYEGEKGPLNCDYWVLDYNLEKAKAQFTQVHSMLKCFEYWMGPYPFYEDGYKLVQAPHLGMEHQSAIAYGNRFENGYLGRDLSGSGWGKKWDFIIVHESAHEWFGNNITSNDLADMWIHESFANYAETLYTTCLFGVEAGDDYCIGTRKRILNDKPITGPYGVNQEGSSDMYYKGGNMLHTIRQVINNDEKFRQILRGLNSSFYHQTVDAAQIENYISQQSGIDFSKVFEQYLRTTKVPELEYRIQGDSLSFRWAHCVDGFAMPVKVKWGDKELWLHPTADWQTAAEKNSSTDFKVDRNFYVEEKRSMTQ